MVRIEARRCRAAQPRRRTGKPQHRVSRGTREPRLHVEVITSRALYTTGNEKYQPPLLQLWEHSIACAHASQVISRFKLIGNPDEVFIMGLLHDIGKLLLLQILADLEARGRSMAGLTTEAQIEFIQAHHGRFGKAVLERWHFPEIHKRIALETDAGALPDFPPPELLVVRFANLLAMNLGYRLGTAETVELDGTELAKMLELRSDEITQVADEVKARVEETRNFVAGGTTS